MIENIHENWFGNWDLLEAHHGYIQWLFPIDERGMNWSSVALHEKEAMAIRETPELQKRVITSYRMMLDFYGLVLVNEQTGEVARNQVHYKARLKHLNHSFHNYLRITRILKCLGLVGLEHYKRPFLHHMALEIFKEKTLDNAGDSCVRFWVPTLRNKDEMKRMDRLISSLGRRIDRKRVDGYGDERNKSGWSVKDHEPSLEGWERVDKLPMDVQTHHCDPFSDIRKNKQRRRGYNDDY